MWKKKESRSAGRGFVARERWRGSALSELREQNRNREMRGNVPRQCFCTSRREEVLTSSSEPTFSRLSAVHATSETSDRVRAMSGRPKMLSSQPKRSWGDSDDENERPEFVLNSEDWPPTPPKPRPAKSSTAASSSSTVNKGKTVARTVVSGAGVKVGSVNYSASGTTASSSRASGSGAMARPLVSRQSEPARTSQPVVDLPLAPLFSRQRPAPSSSSTSRPMSSSASESRIANGSNMFALNNPATAGSNGSALPRKRSLPWEELEASSSRGPRTGSKNFHELSGPAGAANGNKRRISSEMKGKLLTSDSLDVKQKVVLSPEQQVVLKLVVEEGKNVFFTGSAGALA